MPLFAIGCRRCPQVEGRARYGPVWRVPFGPVQTVYVAEAALIEEVLLPAIRESGRSLVEAYAEIPPDGDPDDPSQPALRLAQRLGVSRRNLAVCRALPLPLEDSLLEELEAEAAEKRGDYRVELWDGEIPEEHLEAYGLLLRQIELDEPDEDGR